MVVLLFICHSIGKDNAKDSHMVRYLDAGVLCGRMKMMAQQEEESFVFVEVKSRHGGKVLQEL